MLHRCHQVRCKGWPDGMLQRDGMYFYNHENHLMQMDADTAGQIDLIAFNIAQYSRQREDARDTRVVTSIMRRLVREDAVVEVLAGERPSAFWELRRELIASLRRLRAQNAGAFTPAAVARINIAFANVFGTDTDRPSDCRYVFDDTPSRRRDLPDVRGPRVAEGGEQRPRAGPMMHARAPAT